VVLDEATSKNPINWQQLYRLTRDLLEVPNMTVVLQ
jgi:hypothetical protein